MAQTRSAVGAAFRCPALVLYGSPSVGAHAKCRGACLHTDCILASPAVPACTAHHSSSSWLELQVGLVLRRAVTLVEVIVEVTVRWG